MPGISNPPSQVTAAYLNAHPMARFIFGDNQQRRGLAGAASLRNHRQAYGFITKRYPSNASDECFYNPAEYAAVFKNEIQILIGRIEAWPEYDYLVSKIGAGLANRFHIWEEIIQPGLERLRKHNNVIFLWEMKPEEICPPIKN